MNSRIELTDSPMSAMIKMAEGNPGAATVLGMLYVHGPAIDPDNAFQGFGPILLLDSLGIYGQYIWLLYKDVCGEDLATTLAVLRAVQMGMASHQELAIQLQGRPVTDVNWAPVMLKFVMEALPNFNQKKV